MRTIETVLRTGGLDWKLGNEEGMAPSVEFEFDGVKVEGKEEVRPEPEGEIGVAVGEGDVERDVEEEFNFELDIPTAGVGLGRVVGELNEDGLPEGEMMTEGEVAAGSLEVASTGARVTVLETESM